MRKFVLSYHENKNLTITNYFFECKSEELIPFELDESIWYHESFELTESQEKFLEKFCIDFEYDETILIEEMPETFIRIEQN